MASAQSANTVPILDKKQQDLVSKGREWLQPTKFRSPGSEYAKHVRAYIPGTGAWIRKSPEFQNWRTSARSRLPGERAEELGCLWVKGVPGSGKSVFAASVVHLLEQDEPETPVLFFFFRQIVQRNHDPKYLVRDFASQLLPYSHILRAEIQQMAENWLAVDEHGRDALWEALVRAIDSMDKVYCVADALDEMDDQYFNFISTLRELGLRDPRKIKVLLTSRPVPKIEAVLRRQGIVEIKLQASMMYPDIVKYANARLGSLIPRLSQEKEQLLRDTICQRAQGLFLHARIVTDNLTESLKVDRITEATLPDSLERLPSSLKDVYEEMLIEHAARSGVDREQQVRILSCVINTSRPLRAIELGSLIAHMRGEPKALKRGKELVREGCGRLLEILEDESVSVIHHSFTEFLRDVSRQSTPGAFPVLDSDRAHRKLAVTCLGYLDSIPFQPEPEPGENQSAENDKQTEENVAEGDEISSDSGYSDWTWVAADAVKRGKEREIINDLRLENPLMEYALSNWEHHVKQVRDDDAEVLEALHRCLVPGRAAFELWADGARDGRFRDAKLQSIHMAARVGLVTYAAQLLDRDATLVDARQEVDRLTPLAIAAREGKTEMAKLLLDHGAKPDCADGIGWKPLHYCTEGRNLGVAQLLLERGVRPQTATTKYSKSEVYYTGVRDSSETALEMACRQNGLGGGDDFQGFWDAFAPYLRPEDATKCLHWVRDARRLEAVLKTGFADVDSFNHGRTKLFSAAADHDSDSVRLLLKHGADPNKRCTSFQYGMLGDGEDKDENGQYPSGPTPLHAFAWANYHRDVESSRECLRLLLDAGGDINAKCHHFDGDDGLTPLHFAVGEPRYLSEHLSGKVITELLVTNGAQVDVPTLTEGNVPAHLASTAHPGALDVLIRNGADMGKINQAGMTPLLYLIQEDVYDKRFPPETLDRLLSGGADARAVDLGGNSCFHHLMRYLKKDHGESEWVNYTLPFFRKLVVAGADLNKENYEGVPPLLYYSGKKRDRVTEGIFQGLIQDGLNINARDRTGRGILAVVLETYDTTLESMDMFVGLGADIHARNNSGESLLHQAVRNGKSSEWLQFLVAKGADYMTPDSFGDSLVQFAMKHASKNKKEVIDYLIGLGIPDSDINSRGQTKLHLSSAVGNDDDEWDTYPRHPLFAVLSEYQAKSRSVDETDNNGATPLHYAASIDEDNVGALLKAGADPTRLTSQGVSPLHIAAVARQPNIVGLLLSQYQKRGILDKFLDLCDNGPGGRTALHYACRSGHTETARYLVSYGANVDVVDARGLTPLHAMLEFREESRLWEWRRRRNVAANEDTYLIDLSGEFRPRETYNRPENNERTADIVSMLAEAGADLNREANVDGSLLTPLDVSIRDNYGEAVRELIKHGVTPGDRDAVANVINQAEVDADVKFLFDLSNIRDVPTGKKGPDNNNESKTVRDEVSRLLSQGKYSAIREFAQQGGRVLNPKDPGRSTVLHDLATGGYVTLLRGFREEAHRIMDLGWKEGYHPGTLLGAACGPEWPNLPMIKLLVEGFDMDVNEAIYPPKMHNHYRQATPLHSLAPGHHWWQIEALEYMLQRGADVEARDSKGQTPLLCAISYPHHNGYWKEEMIEILLRHGADPNERGNHDAPETCLEAAGSAAVTKLLLQYGADARDLASSGSLTHAAELLNEEMAELLIEAGQDINFHARKRYPLHEAARRPEGRKLPADWTVRRISMCRFLLRKGADPFQIYSDGTSILQAAIEQHGVTGPLLEMPGLDVERRGRQQRTPLISACVPTVIHREGYIGELLPPATAKPGAIMELLELGAAVDAVDDEGRTALHWFCTAAGAFSKEEKTAFNALLERAPSLTHAKDGEGATPFHLALASRQTWVVRRLIDVGGADIKEADCRGNNALHHYAVDLVGEKTRAAAAAEDFKWLLAQGVDVEARNCDGETPLFIFVLAGWQPPHTYPITRENTAFHDEYLGLLMDAGADVAIRDNRGATLLHVVAGKPIKDDWHNVISDEEKMFKQFLELGVDPRIEDDKMRTAIDCAVARKKDEIVRLFKGEGKKVALDKDEEGAEDEQSEPGYEMVDPDDSGPDE